MIPANKNDIGPILGVFFAALLVTVAIWWSNHSTESTPVATPTVLPLFSKSYPKNEEFTSEINLLKAQGRLKNENELQIRKTVQQVGNQLEIPHALLYCLLFQESRLNHLAGIQSTDSSQGLGQFSYYSFFEVNHQISLYTPRNLLVLQRVLGYDVRPILAKSSDPFHPSSYFHIPTAVTASAIYLNNRYFHLVKLINSRKLKYDVNLMWMLAAMAYNKGTRSILSLWNETEERKGTEALTSFLTDRTAFFATLSDTSLLTSSLRRIWPKKEAGAYAKEWEIHAANIASCATDL